jgi:DNA-binding CsgD family transcriptional regulator
MIACLEEFISASSICLSESQLLNIYLKTVEDTLRDEVRVEPKRIPLVHALTAHYRSRLSELQGGRGEAAKPLTFKETECLRWCKEGKTNWEIGEIMSISEKTVEFHLSNTIKKLSVSNRITAVVKGIQLGLISI